MSVNKVILLGNIGQEPTIRTTQDGKKIASFSLATSEKWKNKQTGEMNEKVEWHRVVVFSDGLLGIVERFVSKGSKLYIEGQLETKKWNDKDGIEKYTTQIVLKGYSCKLEIIGGGNNQSENVEPQVGSEPIDISDDIPF